MSDESAPMTGGDRLERPSAMRRAIAAAMTHSATVPQFTLDADVDCTALTGARDSAGDAQPASVSDVLIAACARTLVDHPTLNSAWMDEGILHRSAINIGTALALEEGLVVPVVRGADGLTVASIAEERRRLDGLARRGALGPDDVFSGTFTISNLGTLGIRRFRAIVQPGQSAILAVGSVAVRPIVVSEQLALRPLMGLALSCDHRVVDGAPAARFLAELVSRLEDPTWIDDLIDAGRLEADRGPS
jgi:pyruvate dehydrogenase E2 component (dihydrolipoamide acetyltransferase)